MAETTNLHLVKPGYDDAADIAVLNSDLDIIDSAVAGKIDSSEKGVANGVATLDGSGVSAQAPKSHTHGNIQNGGTLQTSDVAIANGDKLVITDSSSSKKIARSSTTFDGSTTTTALTPKGTFETFLQTHQDISGLAPKDSPSLTGTPTAPTANTSTENTQIATTAYVKNKIDTVLAASDAMVFKGTIGTGGTVTALPATHNAGWTYKVITAGTYAGKTCEIGDMIICIKDATTASDNDWTVVQSNIDGAVTGPASSTDANVAIFDGVTGKVIKDSGFTIGKSVPSDAVFKYSEISAANIAGTGSSTGLVSGRRFQYGLQQNLKVTNGDVQLYGTHLTGSVPAVTASDNGKFLVVQDGAWTAVTVPDANGQSF